MSGDGSFQKVKAGIDCARLLDAADRRRLAGSPDLVKTLLDAGAGVNVADVRGMTPLMLAVATDRQNIDVIRMLIARGADVNAKSLAGETALDWAVKIGAKPAIDSDQPPPAEWRRRMTHVAVPAAAHADVRTAVERSRALLAKASVVSAANGGCASCHSHNIVDTVEHVAVAKGLARGREADCAAADAHQGAVFLSRESDGAFSGSGGLPITTVFALNALVNSGYQPDRTTDIVVAHLVSQQARNGRWFMSALARPPIGEGPIAVTAYAIRSLKAYAPPGPRRRHERAHRARDRVAGRRDAT